MEVRAFLGTCDYGISLFTMNAFLWREVTPCRALACWQQQQRGSPVCLQAVSSQHSHVGAGLQEDHSLVTHSLPLASTEGSDSWGSLCTPVPGMVLAKGCKSKQ